MEKTTVIILISLVVLVLGVFFFGIRSTTKTIDKTLQEAKHSLYNDSKYNRSKVMIGGSRSKLMTTTKVFLLFVGLLIGYILSHFG
jgi:TRAP-type mannitol/chloroaromatic compound transport system permease large subunit